jgi:hypothetical protein
MSMLRFPVIMLPCSCERTMRAYFPCTARQADVRSNPQSGRCIPLRANLIEEFPPFTHRHNRDYLPLRTPWGTLVYIDGTLQNHRGRRAPFCNDIIPLVLCKLIYPNPFRGDRNPSCFTGIHANIIRGPCNGRFLPGNPRVCPVTSCQNIHNG